MKITVVGFLTIAAVVVLLGLIAYQIGTDIEKNKRRSDERPNSPF
jgi:hypothetical protein